MPAGLWASLQGGGAMRAWLPLVALLPTLAGCTVESPTLEGRPPPPPGLPVQGPGAGTGGQEPQELDLNQSVEAIVVQAPVWARGDSWRWNIDARDGGGGAQQWVVYGEEADHWLLASTDRADAVDQAFFGRSLPGRVQKQTLSGYDQGRPTRYFDFPLQHNKTWTLHIRGQDFLVQANFTRSVEGGRGPGFLVEGQSVLGTRIALTYAPSVKWMTRLQLVDAQGQPIFTRALTGSGANYTGPYFLARSEDLFSAARNGTAAAPPVESFSQGRGYTQLHLLLTASGSGSAVVRVVDPAGQVRYNFTAPGPLVNAFERADLPSVPGPWRVTWNLAGPVEVALRIAGVDVQEGSL